MMKKEMKSVIKHGLTLEVKLTKCHLLPESKAPEVNTKVNFNFKRPDGIANGMAQKGANRRPFWAFRGVFISETAGITIAWRCLLSSKHINCIIARPGLGR